MLRVLYPDDGPTLLMADPGAGTVTLYARDGTIVNQAPYSPVAVDQLLGDGRARVAAEESNEAAIRARIRQAIAVDLDYLAAGTPTAAAVAKQVAFLTRQVIGLARLALADLDTLDGT